MSFDRALDQAVVLERIGDGTEDDWGDAAEAVTGRDEYRGRLVPVDSREVLNGRDTVLVDLLLWLEPRAVLTARDRVTVDGESYEVMADPTVIRDPHVAHHIEVPVRRVVSG